MNKRVFVDSDVILDVLANRAPFYEYAAGIFDLGYNEELELYTTAVVLANVFYILKKTVGAKKSKELLKKLRLVFKVLPISEDSIDRVLSSNFTDFEDGLQYFTAKENSMAVILTRNIQDYKENDILAQTPADFLSIFKSA